MKLSMPLVYAGNPRESADQVVALEKAGLDMVWVAEPYGFDAPTLLGYLAAALVGCRHEDEPQHRREQQPELRHEQGHRDRGLRPTHRHLVGNRRQPRVHPHGRRDVTAGIFDAHRELRESGHRRAIPWMSSTLTRSGASGRSTAYRGWNHEPEPPPGIGTLAVKLAGAVSMVS